MPIISNNKAVVNKPVEKNDSDPTIKQVTKWSQYKAESRRFAKRLFVAGLRERAARMYQCGDYIVTSVDKRTGEVKSESTMLCKDRLCPLCSWRLSRRRFAEMMAVMSVLKEEIEREEYTVKMLTLTVRNVALSDLGQAINTFAHAWHNMSRRDYFKMSCIGWARSLEITYNEKADTYHPHYHVICIWRKGADDTELAAHQLAEDWKHAYKCDYTPVIDLRDVYTKDGEKSSIISGALEALKYAVKPDSIKRIPDKDLAQFAGIIKSFRFVSYGKAIKKARQALGFKNSDLAEVDRDVLAVSDEVIISVMRWNGTAYDKTTLEGEPWRLSKARLELELQAAEADKQEVGGYE